MNVQAEFRRVEAQLDVSVLEREDQAGVWAVEAIADDADGSVYQAQFFGPQAEARAREYAAFKYGV
jgi:hypothetical protein